MEAVVDGLDEGNPMLGFILLCLLLKLPKPKPPSFMLTAVIRS